MFFTLGADATGRAVFSRQLTRFALAALAVTLALLGLIVPVAVKPLLAAGEFASIAMILIITRWERQTARECRDTGLFPSRACLSHTRCRQGISM